MYRFWAAQGRACRLTPALFRGPLCRDLRLHKLMHLLGNKMGAVGFQEWELIIGPGEDLESR